MSESNDRIVVRLREVHAQYKAAWASATGGPDLKLAVLANYGDVVLQFLPEIADYIQELNQKLTRLQTPVFNAESLVRVMMKYTYNIELPKDAEGNVRNLEESDIDKYPKAFAGAKEVVEAITPIIQMKIISDENLMRAAIAKVIYDREPCLIHGWSEDTPMSYDEFLEGGNTQMIGELFDTTDEIMKAILPIMQQPGA